MVPKTKEITWVRRRDLPSRTYRIDRERKRIAGLCDGLEAMRQAVWKVLETERFAHLIYSWDYGAELAGLIGKPASYLYPAIEARITEALLQDERVQGVGPFAFERQGGRVHVTCRVQTIFGALEAETDV